MKLQWEKNRSWIAHFDILGFKSMIEFANRPIPLEIVKSKIDEIINYLKSNIESEYPDIDFQHFADTFIIYSRSERVNDYLHLALMCKRFIAQCIKIRLPVRGAISYGEIIFGHNRKIIMGSAFLESYVYGEDQDWIGLILSPSASTVLIDNNIQPIRDGFTNCDIPMRKLSDDKVYAYNFFNHRSNNKCPFIPFLDEMLQQAPEKEKPKYLNTINFIKNNYPVQTRLE